MAFFEATLRLRSDGFEFLGVRFLGEFFGSFLGGAALFDRAARVQLRIFRCGDRSLFLLRRFQVRFGLGERLLAEGHVNARAFGVETKLRLVPKRLQLLEELERSGQVFYRTFHLRQTSVRARALHRSVQRALRHLLNDVRQVESNSVVPGRD